MDANSNFKPHDLLNLLSHLLNRCDTSDAWTQDQIDQTAYELADNALTFARLTGVVGAIPTTTAELLTDAAACSLNDFARALRFLESARANSARLLVPAERIATLELVGKIQSIMLHGVSEEANEGGAEELRGAATFAMQCLPISRLLH